MFEEEVVHVWYRPNIEKYLKDLKDFKRSNILVVLKKFQPLCHTPVDMDEIHTLMLWWI